MMYGKNLKLLRERMGITQEKLGEYIDVTKQAFNHFENEYTIIPIIHLNTICNYFGVSIDYIFGFTNQSHYHHMRMDIDLAIVRERLKEIRKDHKLTQEKLANILNVAKGTIGNYESKRSIIATPFLYTICRKYKISADYLLGKTNEPKFFK